MVLSADTVTTDDGDVGAREASAAPVPALTAALADPAADPVDLDALAAGHPDLRLPATMIAALRSIAAGQGDDLAETLGAVADHDTPELDRAVRVLQRVPPSTDVTAARIALYSAAGRHDAVLALTHGVCAVDDRTALSLVYRATALAAVGLRAGARAQFTAILRRRWHPAVREFARAQRRAVIGD
jgi:hypothetical protein